MSYVTWEAQVALVTAMVADSLMIDQLDGRKVYDTEIPEGESRPKRYIIVGEIPGDSDASTFGREGRDSLIWIHIWDSCTMPDGSIELGNRMPTELFDRLRELFHRKRIPLDTWGMLLGEIELVRLGRDPFIPYMHGVVQYRILSKAPVAP